MVKKTLKIKRKKTGGYLFSRKNKSIGSLSKQSELDHNKRLHMITRDWVGIQNTAWWNLGKPYTYISKEGTKFKNNFEVGSYVTHQKDPKTVLNWCLHCCKHRSKMIPKRHLK